MTLSVALPITGAMAPATTLQLHLYRFLHHHRSHRLTPMTPLCTQTSTTTRPRTRAFPGRPLPNVPFHHPTRSLLNRQARPSLIVRPSGPTLPAIRPDPPNMEIGWKRTKPIPLEKPKGYVIADFLENYKEFGTKDLLAKAGEIVAMRAKEEAEVLREKGVVEERLITELMRVLRLLEMDFVMVKGVVKEKTLAKARCWQAILVANYSDR